MTKKISFILLFLLFFSCKQSEKNTKQSSIENQPNLYAKHFRFIKFKSFGLLKIINAYPGAPGYTYVLMPRKYKNKLPDSLKKYPVINIPVNRIVVTSTTHLPALEILKVGDKLTGFPHLQYISSEYFIKRIKEGKITEVGNAQQLNTELILKLQPGLVMTFNSGNDASGENKYLTKNGIPVMLNADWMEQNPLGRAEWIKVFGYLFQKEKSADSIFRLIEKNYKEIQKKISNKQTKPLVFQGGIFGDKWFVPGGKSYAAQLIKDAGGIYLWNDNNNNGSIRLNFENALMKLPQTDIWLNPGVYENKQQLSKDIPAVKNLTCYKNNKIYTYNLTKGKTGGVLYFEYSNIHPDWILNDLFHIFYPQNDAYQFHFYQELP